MSVVNKMLQDLETRNAGAQAVHANYTPSQTPRKSVLMAMFWGVLLGVVAMLLWLLLAENTSEPTATALESANHSTPLVEANPVQGDPAQGDPVHTESNTQTALETHGQNDVAVVHTEELTGIADPELASEAGAADSENVESMSDKTNRDATSEMATSETRDPETLSAEDFNQPLARLSDPKSEVSKDSPTFSKSGGSKSTQLTNLKERARLAVKSGNRQAAIPLLRQVLDQTPDDTGVRKQLAATLFAAGDTASAERVIKQGLNQAPGDITLTAMLARLYYSQSDTQQAYTVLSELTAPGPIPSDVLAFRASLAERLGQHQAALSDYQMLLSQQPTNAQWWLGYAVTNERLDKPAEALVSYRRASELANLPKDVMAFVSQRITALTEVQ